MDIVKIVKISIHFHWIQWTLVIGHHNVSIKHVDWVNFIVHNGLNYKTIFVYYKYNVNLVNAVHWIEWARWTQWTHRT